MFPINDINLDSKKLWFCTYWFCIFGFSWLIFESSSKNLFKTSYQVEHFKWKHVPYSFYMAQLFLFFFKKNLTPVKSSTWHYSLWHGILYKTLIVFTKAKGNFVVMKHVKNLKNGCFVNGSSINQNTPPLRRMRDL